MQLPNYVEAKKRTKNKVLIRNFSLDDEYKKLGLGKKFGTIFANKATIIGGIILIVIGLEIFITGIF